jgi:hypothetical protein
MDEAEDPTRQFTADAKAIRGKQARFRKRFRDILPAVEQYAASLLSSMDEKKAIKAFTASASSLPEIGETLDCGLWGPGQFELKRKFVAILRDLAFKKKSATAVVQGINAIAAASYMQAKLAESQGPLAVLPPEIRRFLPRNIVVEVDPGGVIQRVTERFGNEKRTLEVKINRMKEIMRRYNEIVAQVKQDLMSEDERIKMAAIVTAIIMETGIRPGDIGNKAHIFVDGEKVLVDTFGATTLGPGHVFFTQDNFVELRFVGKKGTLNVARLTDPEVMVLLQDYVSRAIEGNNPYIFVTRSGEQFTYEMLLGYFNEKFAGIDPTDFRKLRAAETIFRNYKASQEALYAKIRTFVGIEESELRARVTEAIIETIAKAVEESRLALSHKSETETIESYLDPRITLQFLSRGRVAETLRDAILDNSTVIQFDPLTFVEVASAQTATTNPLGSLRDLLDDLRGSIRGTQF